MENVEHFLRDAMRRYQERVAYEIKRGFRTERFRFADVSSLTFKTATFLQTCGLQKGDAVAIWAPNMPEYPILYFACWLLGLVAVPIDIRTTEETLQRFVTKAGCTLGFHSKVVPGRFPRTVTQTYHLEDLRTLVQELSPLERFPDVLPDDPAEIAFTSGTTGTPKGVLLTHRNLVSNVIAFCQMFPLKKEYRVLSVLPLSHAFAQVVDLLAAFHTGMTVVYLERINPVTVLRAFRKQAITSVALVPQWLHLLLSSVEREVARSGQQQAWVLLHAVAPFLTFPIKRFLFRHIRKRLGSQLQFFGCGSAPLSTKLAQQWEHLGIAIYEGYGATETTALLTINTPSAKRLGSVGKALPGVCIQIDSASHEIKAKGPNISPGYFQNRDKTQQAFSHGWYSTGDIGMFDAEGYLSLTGRENWRIVLPGGEKVYPEDLEKKLNAHPLVQEACIVGVKRAEGERVHAAVITREPKRLDEIIRNVNRTLSSHEQIGAWSLWEQEDFPRTPLFKIDRKKVADAIAGLEEPEAPATVSAKDQLASLLARVTNVPLTQVRETDVLATDLGIDSLHRMELLSLIEQEMGVAIAETEITEQTTVSQLRTLLKSADVVPEELPLLACNYRPGIMKVRALLQNILVFPLHALFVPLHVIGEENLASVKLPAIFYFNHIGIMDVVCALRVLPTGLRQKLVVAATRRLWHEWRRFFVEFWGGGFPFDPKQQIKASLELTGDFLDLGFSILLAPEGGISPDGTLQPFKSGIGFLATQMDVPVVPIKIDPSYRDIFPPMDEAFQENLPKKRKRIWVKIGKPMTFSMQSSSEQATEAIQQAMIAL